MNFVRLIQHIKRKHDTLQGYVAQAVNVGLTVYSQSLWMLFQRLEGMIYTEVCKIQAKRKVAYIYELHASRATVQIEMNLKNN